MDLCLLRIRQSPSGTDKIQGIFTKITPENAQEFGIIPEADAPAFYCHAKGQGKADEEVEKPDAKHAKDHRDQVPGIDVVKTQAIYCQRCVTCGDGDMADVEMNAEDP